ncbi:MAG: putative DNA binding domain-containing protein [Novosphingobium sp.]|nr:putative DNA binding domain-containing protein [Novosphingobium sp.]
MKGPATLSSAPEPFKVFLNELSEGMSSKGPVIFFNQHAIDEVSPPRNAVLFDVCRPHNTTVPQFFEKYRGASLIIWDTGVNVYTNGESYFGIKNNAEFAYLIEYANCLGTEGVALLPTFTLGLSTHNGQKCIDALNEKGFDLRGYIELPNAVYDGSSNFLWAVISKGSFDDSFLYSLSDLSSTFEARSAANFLIRHLSGDPEALFDSCKKGDFAGFPNFYLRKEITSILSNDRNFERKKISDLVHDIQKFDPSTALKEDNAFLLNTVATVSKKDVAFRSLEDINTKHRYYRITLNSEIDRDYAVSFFNTDLGKKVLLSASTGSTIPTLSIKGILALEIPCPPKDVQVRISNTNRNLKVLFAQMDKLHQELVYNPKNVDIIQDDVSKLLDSIGRLSIVDKIKSEIRGGEGKHLEFKQTLSLCMREKQKKDYVETAVLKTLCGFMNTDGGVLLVGVDDDQVITGIDHEMKFLYRSNKDEYLKKIRNLVHANLGIDNSNFLEWEIYDVDGKSVLRFDVKKSTKPVFLKKTDFYIRTNPATDKLVGEELITYISQRFS